MARNPAIQEMLDRFVVPKNTTGVTRAVRTQYRNLANTLARDQQDSVQLLAALRMLENSMVLAVAGGLNPRPVPKYIEPKNQPIAGGATPPKVTTGGKGKQA
jgi:hypothetical protein